MPYQFPASFQFGAGYGDLAQNVLQKQSQDQGNYWKWAQMLQGADEATRQQANQDAARAQAAQQQALQWQWTQHQDAQAQAAQAFKQNLETQAATQKGQQFDWEKTQGAAQLALNQAAGARAQAGTDLAAQEFDWKKAQPTGVQQKVWDLTVKAVMDEQDAGRKVKPEVLAKLPDELKDMLTARQEQLGGTDTNINAALDILNKDAALEQQQKALERTAKRLPGYASSVLRGEGSPLFGKEGRGVLGTPIGALENLIPGVAPYRLIKRGSVGGVSAFEDPGSEKEKIEQQRDALADQVKAITTNPDISKHIAFNPVTRQWEPTWKVATGTPHVTSPTKPSADPLGLFSQ